jgi:alkanesulfonate monooxygenase SsuD/methylene tetrahydromethanopterin reductase-like flavin-dependent oxidoreductase (luciferase family)
MVVFVEEAMSSQDLGRDTSKPAADAGMAKTGAAANDAFSRASDTVRDTAEKAKQAASDTASTVTDQVKELLDRQIGNGANMAGQFASSARLAANDLDQHSPVMAGLVRTVANKIDDYADDLQDRTVEQLTRTASDFTRRQPALVFGVAAVAGFFVFRTVRSGQSMPSAPFQPAQGSEQTWHKNN